MRQSMIATACLAALLAGCATPEQNGVANGGNAANLAKFAAANAVARAKCNDPNVLFYTPAACLSECHVFGSPAWSTQQDMLVNRGLFVADSFHSVTYAAAPFRLMGNRSACLQQCKVDGAAVRACQAQGYWHPDAVVRHFIDVPYINDAGMHSSTWRKEVQPTFDPAYSHQSIVVAIADAGGDVGTQRPLDRMTADAQAAIGQLTSNPLIVASLNALGQALGRHDPIRLVAPISAAQSFQAAPAKSLGKNPAGVQWPITFDGNISVDQSVN